MKVNLVRSNDLKKSELIEIYNILFSQDGPISFIKCNKPIFFNEDIVSWDTIFDECIQYRIDNNIPVEDYIVLLMSEQNEENWFSTQNPTGSNEIFIHTGDWGNYLSSDSIYAVAFQVIENILQGLMFDKIEDGFQVEGGSQYFHDPAIGCINDMCSWKPDITFKLRTADICDHCMNRLQERGTDEKIIKQSINIFEHIRKKTLFSRSMRADINIQKPLIPFPVAITKRKLNMTIEPLRKFLLLLDHFDSIIRTTVILFGKIALTNNLDHFFIENNLDHRPSLGNWVNALQKITNIGTKNIKDNINLDKEFFKRIRSILKKAEDDKIVRLRNEKRGHGYCDCNDTSYSELFSKISPSLECIENILNPLLIRCKCYYVSSNCILDDKFSVKVKPIMGNHPDFIEKVVDCYPEKISDIPKNFRIYLHFGDNPKWYDLHPYIIYDNCPICSHQRVLIKDGQSYLDPYIGHLVTIDLNCNDHHVVI